MKKHYFNCGAGIEDTCRGYNDRGQHACENCKFAMQYYNDIVDPFVLDDFIGHIERCETCSHSDCAICGEWFPYVDYKAMPEYKEALDIVQRRKAYQISFNPKEKFIFDITLAISYPSGVNIKVKTALPKEKAIILYEHSRLLANNKGIITREYKSLDSIIAPNGAVITIFVF